MMKTIQKIYILFKRIISIIGSLIGLIIFALPMLIIAIGIKCTSKGPVLFKQKRFGKNKKIFTMYKFRSMRIDAPETPLASFTEEEQKHHVYKFGAFLRKTSLDELPQLFNIIKGDMSFIGPRPSMVVGDDILNAARDAQDPSPFKVNPGLSGYAQIHTRINPDPDKKAEMDSYYVKKLSFWLDIKIFFFSILVFFGYSKGK